jgi:FtsP/CotA-like multicopper oxidase with cupredoxin domain
VSRGQRFTFLAIALVIAVAAIVVLADTSEDETEPTQSAATATPTATESPGAEETPTATPTPTPRPQPPLLTAGRVRELEYTEGDTIRFRVRSDAPEEIHVHCYDITRDVPPGRTISVSFEADITGICEVEFHNSGESIAELRVEPR